MIIGIILSISGTFCLKETGPKDEVRSAAYIPVPSTEWRDTCHNTPGCPSFTAMLG